MPIYEYVCPNCGQSFEKLILGGGKARQVPAECPNCGTPSHRKEVTLIASFGSEGSVSLSTSSASCAPSG